MAYDTIKTIVDEYNTAKSLFEKKMKDSFKEIFKEFFDNYPEIQAIGWEQYTPYFNDGEPCVFSVGEKSFLDQDTSLEDAGESFNWESKRFRTEPADWVRKLAKNYIEGVSEPYNRSYVENVEAWEKIKDDPRLPVVMDGLDELFDILNQIPDEIYLSSFGDHVSVVVTRKGFTVDDYDHD